MPRNLLAPLLAAACLCAPLAAAPLQLKVDTSASTIHFTADATLHSFEGWMRSWHLALSMPEGAELPDSVVLKGDTRSLTTVHEKRDKEMHHWLEDEKLPDLVFRLSRFSGTPEARVAEGELTLHGSTVPVAFPVQVQRDGSRLTISGQAQLDTRQFGLPQFRKFGLLSVDTEVRIDFKVTGVLE